jgi:hypothetical protein
LGCIDKIFFSQNIDIITLSIVFVGLGSALLSYRKFKSATFTLDDSIASKKTEIKSCHCCELEDCKCQKINS